MDIIHCDDTVREKFPAVVEAAELVVSGMYEAEADLFANGRTFELRFKTNHAWFRMMQVSKSAENVYNFGLFLFTGIGERNHAWSTHFTNTRRENVRSRLQSLYHNGFPVKDSKFMWDSAANPGVVRTPLDMGKLPECHCLDSVRQNNVAVNIARVIARNLSHFDVYLTGNPRSGFLVRFETNSSFFKIVELREGTKPGRMTFELQLVVHDLVQWRQLEYDISLEQFDLAMRTLAESGFETCEGIFKWRNTLCARQTVDLGEEDFKPRSESPSSDSMSVPANVGKVRVVALKYDGRVIAYRFKTDAGSFDMQKSVAMKFGFGDFKTETFIQLKSVGGMLMSDSECKKRRCVPDVSDDEGACKRLVDALFDS